MWRGWLFGVLRINGGWVYRPKQVICTTSIEAEWTLWKGSRKNLRARGQEEEQSSRCDVGNVVIILQQLCWPVLGLHTPTRSVNSQLRIWGGGMYSYPFTLNYWIPGASEKGYGYVQLWTHWQAYHASMRFQNLWSNMWCLWDPVSLKTQTKPLSCVQ